MAQLPAHTRSFSATTSLAQRGTDQAVERLQGKKRVQPLLTILC